MRRPSRDGHMAAGQRFGGMAMQFEKTLVHVLGSGCKRHDGTNPKSRYNRDFATDWYAWSASGYSIDVHGDKFHVVKTGNEWLAIDPNTGLRVGRGKTRKSACDAIEQALPKFRKYFGTDEYKEKAALWSSVTATVGRHVYTTVDGHTIVGYKNPGAPEVWASAGDSDEQQPEQQPEPKAEPKVMERTIAKAPHMVVQVVEPVKPVKPKPEIVEQSKQEPEPPQAKPKEETRPERFNREFGEAYDAILRLQEEYNPGHPEHVTDSGVEWNDLSVAIRALTLVGERFMREHPRMLKKFIKWHEDMFTSDREVAALGMVGTRWLEETEQRKAAETA